MTDAMQALAGNSARAVHGGTEITKRWIDLVGIVPQDTRTGDEIALDVIKRAGLIGR